jgi:hypothetical protein
MEKRFSSSNNFVSINTIRIIPATHQSIIAMRNTNIYRLQHEQSLKTFLPPRELDDRTKLTLNEMLCSFPRPKKIRVVAVFGDPEQVFFAQEIRNYLAATGWDTEPVIEIAAQTIQHSGVYLRMNLNDPNAIEVVVGENNSL